MNGSPPRRVKFGSRLNPEGSGQAVNGTKRAQ